MNDMYSDVKDKAAEWGLTLRQVQYLCAHGRIPGARRFGRSWAIPADAEKPLDRRRAQAEQPEAKTLNGVPIY